MIVYVAQYQPILRAICLGRKSIKRTIKTTVADVSKMWAVLGTSWAASGLLMEVASLSE